MITPAERAAWTADIERLARCHRCRCLSCANGFENHSHGCTGGPHCIETPAKQRARVTALKVALARAGMLLREAERHDP